MALLGMPDLQQPFVSEGFNILYPYGKVGNYRLLPDRLQLASRSDGSPDIVLEFVRGLNPRSLPKPHGILELRLKPSYRIDEALAEIRKIDAQASLEPLFFANGFLHIVAINAEELPQDLSLPAPLSWNGLGSARSVLRLSTITASLFKRAMETDLLALNAFAEVEMMGVSPRFPILLSFDPSELLAALWALRDGSGRILQEKIVELVAKDPAALSLSVSGDMGKLDRKEFAQAVADRIKHRFGSLVPSDNQMQGPSISLNVNDTGKGTIRWDLSEPILISRAITLDLRLEETISKWTRQHGLEGLYREVVVPVINTGFLPVSVSANLPPFRIGVFSLGVTLRAPPNPPLRAQALVESLELFPPEDSGRLVLQFSPSETQAYSLSTFAVVQGPQGIVELSGELRPYKDDRIDLLPEDFPIDFVSVKASRDLLNIAAVKGVCRQKEGEEVFEQPFDLTASSEVAIAVPKGSKNVTLEIEARSVKDGKTLRLGPLETRSLALTLASFSQYGPHRILIECTFGQQTDLYAIDLLPEDRPEDSFTVIHFTPSSTKAEWTWFAESPFSGGYRYREHRGPDEAQLSWSAVMSPFDLLSINPAKSLGGQI